MSAISGDLRITESLFAKLERRPVRQPVAAGAEDFLYLRAHFRSQAADAYLRLIDGHDLAWSLVIDWGFDDILAKLADDTGMVTQSAEFV